MEYRVIVSGFGGQGVLFFGKILAQAAVLEGKEVSWLPSYGPEMRGGTANCRITVSDEEISSPAFNVAQAVVAMNLPSVEKFRDKASELFITDNSFGITGKDVLGVDTAPCKGGKFDKLTNMVMLGAFVEKTGTVKSDSVFKTVRSMAGEYAELDIEAIKYGMSLVKGKDMNVR